MRALPEEFEASALTGLLADGWGFDVEAADYAPLGGGSYHWAVSDPGGTRGFVTVDDLDRKPWLGDTRDLVFDGLKAAFDTAVALRKSGLDFVVAPLPTKGGETVRRVGPRYTIALFRSWTAKRVGSASTTPLSGQRSSRCSPSSVEQRLRPVRAGWISSCREGASLSQRFEI